MNQEMKRIVEVMDRRDAQAAMQRVEADGLTAMLMPHLSDVWDLNWVYVEEPGLPIERIVAFGDETIGAAGMGHRTLLTMDPAEGERLIAELEPRGWEVERNVYMALRGEPDRPADPGIEVDEVGLNEIEEARREFLRLELAEWIDPVTDEVLDQFIAADRLWGEIAGDRWFVVREDSRIVNFCRLFTDGGIAQVEDVATLPAARNRGYARATILAAIDAARAEDPDLIYLGALTDDWPRKLYARLGFEEVGPEVVLYMKPSATPRS